MVQSNGTTKSGLITKIKSKNILHILICRLKKVKLPKQSLSLNRQIYTFIIFNKTVLLLEFSKIHGRREK